MTLLGTEEHEEIVSTLNNMAFTYAYLGEKEKALKIHERIYSREIRGLSYPKLIL